MFISGCQKTNTTEPNAQINVEGIDSYILKMSDDPQVQKELQHLKDVRNHQPQHITINSGDYIIEGDIRMIREDVQEAMRQYEALNSQIDTP